ncbi:MAG: class I SAM-dependent methyltransferase [Planctomycetes bacterium]|nr:class I SAM-dependent methyltransferase [Planctomycetota bacterium]NOG53532.1 class I SAM-dependent methyltransferase [Planctomycetota bacterium]
MAARADRHALYEQAVQGPEAEVGFIDRVYKKSYGRVPTLLREDFCGTSIAACEWVRRRRGNRAIGVDLDSQVLEWAEGHNIASLTADQRSRITLLNEDVLQVRPEPVQVITAMNFSYMTFKERSVLRSYFRQVREGLQPEGLFICDCYGGTEAQDTIEEDRACDGFTYIWEQADFNPVTNETLCHIHFTFPDGSKMKRAFTYDWRLWSIAEIREIAHEAGFSQSTVYWEGTDSDTDEGNGVFRPTTKGEVCAGWVSYIVFE